MEPATQPDHRETLEYAHHVIRWEQFMASGVLALARALLAVDAECDGVRRERDVNTPLPLVDGLYLMIRDTAYRVEIQTGQDVKNVRRLVKLTKLTGIGDEHYCVQYTDDTMACTCGSWEFTHSKIPDHRTYKSACKHLRAIAEIGLIELPASVVTRRPVPEGEAT